jgi:DNA mismatch endonuclease (patch repair protein)
MRTKSMNKNAKTNLTRSDLMRKVKSRETKVEILFRKNLWASGIRYRKNFKKLPGSPDIAITKIKLAVFIDGAFWHGYNWAENNQKIKSNREYWIPKIERNMKRDIKNVEALNQLGYTVFRFWENEVKRDLQGCIAKIVNLCKINSN